MITTINEFKNSIKESYRTTYKNGDKILYDGFFITDVPALMKIFQPVYDKTYYHHMTTAFMPKQLTYPELLGKKEMLKIVGRITTDKVDALLLESDKTKNEFPHITLSVAPGVKPVESNNAFKNEKEKIQYFDQPIFVESVYGYE